MTSSSSNPLKTNPKTRYNFNKEVTLIDNEKCDRWGTGKQIFSSLSQNTAVRVKLSVVSKTAQTLVTVQQLYWLQSQLKRMGQGVN